MRPEHVAANELVDIAITGDREAYKAKLTEIEAKFSRVAADTIKQQAAMQYRMETNDRRFTGWRADWINERQKVTPHE